MGRRGAKVDLLKQYMQVALGAMFSTTFAVLKIPNLVSLYREDPLEGILSFALFLLTIAWLAGWIYFDHLEIQYIDDYFSSKPVKMKSEPFLSGIFIGILAGLLFGFTDNPKIYIMIAMIELVLGMFGGKIVRGKLCHYFIDDPEFREGIPGIICDYYLKRHFNRLDITALVVLSIGLFLAWYSFFTKEATLLILSYIIPIVTILVHELWIWSWRISRERLIDQVFDKETTTENTPESKKVSV